MKIVCNVCGKTFKAGNDPITGIPNGFGLQFEETGNALFNVCSFCIAYRNSKVIEMAEKFKGGDK